MNENTKEKHLSEKLKTGFPKKLLIWTLGLALVLGILHWQSFNLNDAFNMNPAVPWLVSLLLIPVTILMWGLWTFFWAKLRLVGLFILMTPIVFFTLYAPNFLGDANFIGFKPRFWTRDANFAEVTSEAANVDVATTTPFDFPQFLGANRNAQVDSVRLKPWAGENGTLPEQLWKIDIGEGWSGFAVVNGFAITQEQRGAEELVTCYDIQTGELKWANRAARRHEDRMGMGKVGPRATPTIHQGRVYATSATGVLDCLDGATGENIWTVDVPNLVGIKQMPNTNSLGLEYTQEDSTMTWGRSGSPLIVDDMVVVIAGGPAPAETETPPTTATLIAFDKNTGEERWRGGKRMVGYGSPSLATVAGTRQILLTAEQHAVGHDVATGKELWNFERPGQTSGAANCSQVTVISNDQLMLTKGYGAGGELVKVEKDDNGSFSVTSIKKSPRVLKTKLTNPVIYQGHAYSLSDGFLECAEVETLRRKWKQRGRFGNGQLLLVGDKLIVHCEVGGLYLVEADPTEFKEVGAIDTIEGICWNTIALYNDLLLVRSELEAACYRLPTESQ